MSSEAQIIASNCKFIQNFAFHGGVAYLQNDGNLTIDNSTFTNNFAIRASLFFIFNSYNSFRISGGIINKNGFIYHNSLDIKMLIIQPVPKQVEEGFSKNQLFLDFLKSKMNEIQF